MKRVLLTNALQRKALVCARSLGLKGVDIIAAETTRMTPTAFSKYCSKALVSPNPLTNPNGYYQWLEDTLKKFHCEVMLPVDDDTLEIIMANKSKLEKLCRIILPPTESYHVASDKGLSVKAAQEAGLDCPETIMVSDLASLPDIIKELSFPAVIKPRKSSGSRGIRIVTKKEEFTETYLNVHAAYPYPLIQEYIPPGDKYDVCMLFNRENQLQASFVQKELRHFPVGIGPSTIQESVSCPELVQKSLAFMNKLQWQGIVELEFMFDKNDGKFKFMEINPRFWNSLYMAILAGVDFPWLLYRLTIGESIEPVTSYKTGLKCRWLLPGDILHFLANKDRREMNPPFLAGAKQGVYDDIISKSDPLPVFGFFLACLRYLPDWHMWKHIVKR